MTRYVGAVDQGTTSTRFMVFDHGGQEVARHQLEHAQILPQAGWVEHDPVEIYQRVCETIEGALSKANLTAQALSAVGITNQRVCMDTFYVGLDLGSSAFQQVGHSSSGRDHSESAVHHQ